MENITLVIFSIGEIIENITQGIFTVGVIVEIITRVILSLGNDIRNCVLEGYMYSEFYIMRLVEG